MPDLLLEQNYYDALLSGSRFGNESIGASLTPEAERAMEKAARKMAAQAEEMIFQRPEDKEKMVEAVTEWLNGDMLDMNELRAQLRPMFGEARALRIARTETARTMNLGNSAVLRSNGWTKIIWMASAGACEACEEMNGTVMTIDDYEEKAILHPNCACTSQPVDDDTPETADFEEAAEAVDGDAEEMGIGDFTAGVETLND